MTVQKSGGGNKNKYAYPGNPNNKSAAKFNAYNASRRGAPGYKKKGRALKNK